MSREISRAESWERAYESFQEINFTAFDYDTVKQSLLDYIKLYFPENFNDFIESSEFIAIVELFAYISELIAYRIDMNAHENFISTAERKQSILRLAKLVSYNASRNLPARGLVKINSITTTESVFDSRGVNLANTKIIWNDTNNQDWKEQFLLVLNRVMQQEFGTVSPSERVQVDDVLFELYELSNRELVNGVIPYNVSVGGTSVPMELTPVALNSMGPYERRPEIGSKFSILFGSDGIGDASDTTGFFMFTKQGSLQRIRRNYDGITPNQTETVEVDNINDIDVWVNNVDADTGKTIKTSVVDPLGNQLGISGEWEEVDVANAQNILFNTNPKRNKYEVETLEDDQIRIIYGDGELSDIPSGDFDIWYRESINEDIVIPKPEVSNRQGSLRYLDINNSSQTFSFTYSLVNALTNSVSSETIESIQRMAPAIYYTQDRMVNGRDYNTFLLQDASILRERAFNRTYAGHSKYLTWHDPSEHYENVKMFGDDLSLFYQADRFTQTITNGVPIDRVLVDFMQPLLFNSGVLIFHASEHLPLPRRKFNASERTQIAELNVAVENAGGSGYPLQVAYIPDNQRGYQFVDFGGNGLTNSDTELERGLLYVFELSIDGVQIGDDISFQFAPSAGSPADPVTFSELITELRQAISNKITSLSLGITPPNVLLSGGNLYIQSATVGSNSSIEIVDVNLFNKINQYVGLSELVNGTNSSVWRGFKSSTLLLTPPTFTLDAVDSATWEMTNESVLLTCISPTTRFWFNNGSNRIVNGQTLTSSLDNVVLLGANLNRDRNSIQGSNYELNVVGSTIDSVTPNIGLPSLTELNLITQDVNGDLIPDDVILDGILDMRISAAELIGTATVDPTRSGHTIFNLPNPNSSIGFETVNDYTYLAGYDEISVRLNNVDLTLGIDFFEVDIDGTLKVDGTTGTYISIDNNVLDDLSAIDFIKLDFIFFQRETSADPYVLVDTTNTVKLDWFNTRGLSSASTIRRRGRSGYNFAWLHTSPRFNLIDPSTTNIIDIYTITRGYYTQLRNYLKDEAPAPVLPTPFQLRVDYSYLLESKMISDVVVLHPGNIKVILGNKAIPQLQATIKVIRSTTSNLTNNEVKVRIVELVRTFFDINKWEFGETFNFSQLAAYIHAEMPGELTSVVLVPSFSNNYFGDLYQIFAKENEIIQPHITVGNVEVVEALNPTNLRQATIDL